jgi:hypothetical protein
VIEGQFECPVGAKAVGFSHGDFYAKVVKVKADVAALLNSFPPAITFASGRPAEGCTSAETNPGGSRKGGSADRLETPLAGGAAAWAVPAVLAGAERVAAWGEPSPPRLPPGGNGKGGSNSLLPQAVSLALMSSAHFLKFTNNSSYRRLQSQTRSGDNVCLIRSCKKSCWRHPLIAMLLSAL